MSKILEFIRRDDTEEKEYVLINSGQVNIVSTEFIDVGIGNSLHVINIKFINKDQETIGFLLKENMLTEYTRLKDQLRYDRLQG